MLFCERLREARKKAGLTQAVAAEKLGVRPSTVSGYELGTREPTAEMLIMIMKAYEVDANYLFQDDVSGFILSDSEHEIVQVYRGLNDENAAKVLAYAQALATIQSVEAPPESKKDTA